MARTEIVPTSEESYLAKQIARNKIVPTSEGSNLAEQMARTIKSAYI